VFSTDDTIVAVATPAGHGGVGLVRLSGTAAAAIGHGLTGHTRAWPARYAVRAAVATGGLDADALVTFFPAPASYTGEDVLEVSAHGSPVILAAIVRRAVELGARPARAGEFTLRAFVHGKLDLVQAEAVRDLVEAVSPAQVRAAAAQLDGSLSTALASIGEALRRLETLLEASMDFPDEGYRFIDPRETAAALVTVRDRIAALVATGGRGQLVRDGARVVVAGLPNVGKSSVFNALVGTERAIVTAVAGTTRDLVSERLVIDGALVLLVDTAGLRDGVDEVEIEGVRRAREAMDGADVVVLVLDRSRAMSEAEHGLLLLAGARAAIVVGNKADLPAAWEPALLGPEVLQVSATSGHGVNALGSAIARTVTSLGGSAESVLVTNERHRVLLTRALESVDHAVGAMAAAGDRLPEEFVVADLRGALEALEEVTGRRTADALLDEIFSTFCIGK
jgi:tRNA modification GTPase